MKKIVRKENYSKELNGIETIYIVVVVVLIFTLSFFNYSQLSLRRTPLGPALSVRLREVSVL